MLEITERKTGQGISTKRHAGRLHVILIAVYSISFAKQPFIRERLWSWPFLKHLQEWSIQSFNEITHSAHPSMLFSLIIASTNTVTKTKDTKLVYFVFLCWLPRAPDHVHQPH